MLSRRELLLTLAASALRTPAAFASGASPSESAIRIGATWRGVARDSSYRIGVLELDPAGNSLRIMWSQPLPGRAHGLVTGTDGSLLVVAVRPGQWMQRYDANGRLQQALQLDTHADRHFTGHAIASADGQLLYTGETDPRDDSGWIGVRDIHTLQLVSQWPTHGVEPHDLKLDATGALIVANGGIRRASGDRKRELERMDSSLVRLAATDGALLGQWRADDPRLSLRHMSWSHNMDGSPLLGIALQAEHDSPEARRDAPVLATWDGAQLEIPSHAADANGYAGDIATAPRGGFILSSNQVGRALWWHPSAPGKLTQIAQLTEAYALSSHRGGAALGGGGTEDTVLISSARGAAAWNPARPAVLLPWPEAMVLENHWVAFDPPHRES